MAQTPEKRVKDKIKKLITEFGGYYTMPVMTGMGSNGTPDILACVDGRFLGIEAKAGKGRPTKLQLLRLREIYAAGGSALIINENELHKLRAILERKLYLAGPVTNLMDWDRRPLPQ